MASRKWQVAGGKGQVGSRKWQNTFYLLPAICHLPSATLPPAPCPIAVNLRTGILFAKKNLCSMSKKVEQAASLLWSLRQSELWRGSKTILRCYLITHICFKGVIKNQKINFSRGIFGIINFLILIKTNIITKKAKKGGLASAPKFTLAKRPQQAGSLFYL